MVKLNATQICVADAPCWQEEAWATMAVERPLDPAKKTLQASFHEGAS